MVAFFHEDIGDSAESLGSDVGICGWLNLAGSRHDRNQIVRRRHFGRLNRYHAFVSLVDAEQHDAYQHPGHDHPDDYLFPRLHM